jgi:hypothetical protein
MSSTLRLGRESNNFKHNDSCIKHRIVGQRRIAASSCSKAPGFENLHVSVVKQSYFLCCPHQVLQ